MPPTMRTARPPASRMTKPRSETMAKSPLWRWNRYSALQYSPPPSMTPWMLSSTRCRSSGWMRRVQDRLSGSSVSSAWPNSSCMPSLHHIASLTRFQSQTASAVARDTFRKRSSLSRSVRSARFCSVWSSSAPCTRTTRCVSSCTASPITRTSSGRPWIVTICSSRSNGVPCWNAVSSAWLKASRDGDGYQFRLIASCGECSGAQSRMVRSSSDQRTTGSDVAVGASIAQPPRPAMRPASPISWWLCCSRSCASFWVSMSVTTATSWASPGAAAACISETVARAQIAWPSGRR